MVVGTCNLCCRAHLRPSGAHEISASRCARMIRAAASIEEQRMRDDVDLGMA